MDQNSAETSHILQSDTKAIDAWLKSLWDRAKKAAELIARLREEKKDLQARVSSLESELLQVRNELAKNEELIRSLSTDRDDAGRSGVLNGEQDQLGARVKVLLAKLDEYL